jgi:hypothetical protein
VNRTRILITLTTTILILAATTTTATAFFKTSFNQYPTTIRATGINHTFTAAGGLLIVVCQAEFQGNAQNPGPAGGSQLTVRPYYNQCHGKLNGGAPVGVTVTTNGCIYNLHQAKGATKGEVSVQCPGTNTIEFEVVGCAIKVGQNLNLKGLTYTNEGSPKKVNVKTEIKGIKYTAAGCGELIKAGVHEDAEYTSESKTVGEFGGAAEGVEAI